MNLSPLAALSPLLACAVAHQPVSSTSIPLLIRCDDIGMCHAANMACKEVAESGIPFSASVMATCPWYTEAAEILASHPNISVGVHLTLNAEWKGYRWGPVLGRTAVPSLVDSLGSFFHSREALMANHPEPDEVERELRAQIQRAMSAGLKPEYVDYHMDAAVGTPELRAIVEKLAADFGLGMSLYFGERDVVGLYDSPPTQKTAALLAITRSLRPEVRQLVVFHIGYETQEMDALVDLNPFGPREMSKNRNGERLALLSSEFRNALKQKNVTLITYRDLLRTDSLSSMKRPAE